MLYKNKESSIYCLTGWEDNNNNNNNNDIIIQMHIKLSPCFLSNVI